MKHKKWLILTLLMLAAVLVLTSCSVREVVKINAEAGGSYTLEIEMTKEQYEELNKDGSADTGEFTLVEFEKDGVPYVRLSQTQDFATYEELCAHINSSDSLTPVKDFTITKNAETGDITIGGTMTIESSEDGSTEGGTEESEIPYESFLTCFEMPGNILRSDGCVTREGDKTVVIDFLELAKTPGTYSFEVVSADTYTPPRAPWLIILLAVGGVTLVLGTAVLVVGAVVAVVLIVVLKKKKAHKLTIAETDDNVLSEEVAPDLAEDSSAAEDDKF